MAWAQAEDTQTPPTPVVEEATVIHSQPAPIPSNPVKPVKVVPVPVTQKSTQASPVVSKPVAKASPTPAVRQPAPKVISQTATASKQLEDTTPLNLPSDFSQPPADETAVLGEDANLQLEAEEKEPNPEALIPLNTPNFESTSANFSGTLWRIALILAVLLGGFYLIATFVVKRQQSAMAGYNGSSEPAQPGCVTQPSTTTGMLNNLSKWFASLTQPGQGVLPGLGGSLLRVVEKRVISPTHQIFVLDINDNGEVQRVVVGATPHSFNTLAVLSGAAYTGAESSGQDVSTATDTNAAYHAAHMVSDYDDVYAVEDASTPQEVQPDFQHMLARMEDATLEDFEDHFEDQNEGPSEPDFEDLFEDQFETMPYQRPVSKPSSASAPVVPKESTRYSSGPTAISDLHQDVSASLHRDHGMIQGPQSKREFDFEGQEAVYKKYLNQAIEDVLGQNHAHRQPQFQSKALPKPKPSKHSRLNTTSDEHARQKHQQGYTDYLEEG